MTAAPLSIVLVDDAADVRLVVGTQLGTTNRFAVVGEGGTGREAIELARQHRPDLMLLDVSMPDMDGLEALPEIMSVSPNTRVVMFSGFGAAGLGEQVTGLGAVAYLEKSVPIEELPARLLRAAGFDAVADDIAISAPSPSVERHEALSDHLERFRGVFERAMVGMATLSLTGTIARVNPALARLMDRPEHDLVGQSFLTLVPENEKARIRDALQQVTSASSDVVSVDHRVAGRDRLVHSTMAPVRDPNGSPLYVFVQVEDVTDQVHAYAALRESEQRFRLLVDSVVDYAIFILDPEGYVASWNPGAERIKGYRAEEIIGQHFGVFYPEESRSDGHPQFELDVARRDGRYQEEGWRVRKDGSHFLASIVLTALHDENGELVGFAKITRDVTERLEAARLLQEAAEEKANFLAVTAHELRSPVVAITAGAQMLVDHWRDLEESERDTTMGAIQSSARRIRRLVDDLLMASRLDAGALPFDITPVPLHAAISEATAQIATPEPISVVGPTTVTALVDHGRLTQIVTNLVQNALAYGSPPVTVTITPEDGTVVLRVRDAGPGVPPALVPRLFDKFSRGKGKRDSGAGLGLFIVRELARGQGGDAWFEEDPAGAVFAVRLPAAPA